jgi:hypothetical protein
MAGAIACCSSEEWSGFTLEQRNRLTMFLHTHARERYRRWNDIVRAVKEAVNPLVERKVAAVIGQLAGSARWDILGACMEWEYADVGEPGFFTGLMQWYLGGRFPCGWGDRDAGGTIRLYGPLAESDYHPSETDWLKLVLVNQERLFRPNVRLPAVGKLLVY